MNEKNIEMLKARLQSLGFAAGVEERLRSHICFGSDQFELDFSMDAGKDHCEIRVLFIQGEKSMYDVVNYAALYRKAVIVPETLSGLDHAMRAIDWVQLYAARKSQQNDKGIVLLSDKAWKILHELSEHAEGDLLKYKYWIDTPLEDLIPSLSYFRSLHEISQRFYFMDEQQPISAGEALRFLQSRWMEKKVITERKLLVKKERPSHTEKKGGSGGKLLSKRPRSSRKGLLDK